MGIRYSFQPGPSQLYPNVPSLIQKALQEGLLTRYHRDPVWRELFTQAQKALTHFLELPPQWLVVFTSSATETWQILVDATQGLRSLHITQGTFGERWHALQRAANSSAKAYSWDFRMSERDISFLPRGVDYLAIVHTETSVGAAFPFISEIRAWYPEAWIAVDATSSMGGVRLPWEKIDMVFASVQKCLGLPPGLGVLVLSPRAIAHYGRGERSRYNSLCYLIQRAIDHEPPHTPNLLNIYLLAHSLGERPPLSEIEAQLISRQRWLYQVLNQKGYKPLISEPYRAITVLSVSPPHYHQTNALFASLQEKGFYLGRGYGRESKTFFRIANFPALSDHAYEELLSYL
ncbi:MAG: aminotransferase class V-fold PLP-dependent enzyme [Bacteroidia bacterium]|nr:aminotransferase class V-fold PLP-dependent enzyme [Bacteroidia bacterium]MDW8235367.1 aminotransferase class V-fold PLP-dependent enzyme [Bacteroidia bacterium]